MRRFELSEGTSNKFWQATVSAAELTTMWGRIGTSGQSKTKAFGAATAAQREFETLVKEKLAKGYVEVGKAKPTAATPKTAAPAKTAAVKPVPKTTAARKPHDGLLWSEEIEASCAPLRGATTPAPISFNARDAAKRVAELFRSSRDAWEKARPLADKKLAARVSGALARLGDATAPLGSVEIESVALFILGWNDTKAGDALVKCWIAGKGAPFALAALVASCELTLSKLYTHGPQLQWVNEAKGEWPKIVHTRVGGWGWFREYLGRIDDPTWLATHAQAEQLRKQGTLTQRMAIAALFPEVPEWAEKDAADARRLKRFDLLVGALVPIIRDAKLQLALVDGRSPFEVSGSETADCATLTMVRSAGPGAARALLAMRPSGHVLTALATIDTPEAVEEVMAYLDSPDVLLIGRAMALKTPRLAIPVLAQLCAERNDTKTERAVLKTVVTEHPAAAKDVLPELSPAARRIVEALSGKAAPTTEATTAQLPAVLVEPPWLPRVNASASFTIAAKSLPDAMVWAPDQKQDWVCWASTADEQLARIPKAKRAEAALKRLDLGKVPKSASVAQVQAAIAKNIKTLSYHISYLNYLPAPLALAIWEAMPPRRWSLGIDWWAAFLVEHELAALPGLVRVFEENMSIIHQCLPFRTTKLALPMAQALATRKTAREGATAWLLAHPEHAATALVPIAVSTAKSRTAAIGALRVLTGQGCREIVNKVAARYGDEVTGALATILYGDPTQFPSKLPDFVHPRALTRPVLSKAKTALPVAAVETLCKLLAGSRLDAPYAGLTAIKEACEPRSLAQFAWELFNNWLLADGPPKEAWAFWALGTFGDDEVARQLAALIREWPGEARHARAVTGLDLLQRIGSDVALMHLNGIAQKVKYRALQDRARAKIDAIAQARGLTSEELGDRLVPDLGLDANGTLTLDYGARRFKVGFDEHLRPFVLDETGKRLPELPKPLQSDDPIVAANAQARWKSLKQDTKTIAKQQVLRLELAMCFRRRWDEAAFRLFLVEHPVLRHLVRSLVWGVHDKQGKLIATFRVAEDGSYANPDDSAFTIPSKSTVGIAHALDLPPAVAIAWSRVFGDYEILQPFAQLGRDVHALTKAEAKTDELVRWKGKSVATGRVRALEARGWRRGPVEDGGCVSQMTKTLGQKVGTAILEIEPGILVGSFEQDAEQTLGKVLLEGPRHYADLDPILISELLRDIEGLRS